ncbi:MAG: UDP-N-acetylmuramate--L-alanine ligase [Halanaerobiales bacterium]
MSKKIHLIGIGGISMSGIAKLLLEKGYQVSGSDIKESHLIEELKELGAEISIGHAEDNIRGADEIVVSSAIPEDNPEYLQARQDKIPIYKRAKMLARLMEGKKGIAISGTHGKTTTTSMLATIMDKNGLSPAIMLGGEMAGIGGNVKSGSGEYFVTEADESDGSFLYFDPMVVVVTNIELDHVDYFDSRQKLLKTFLKFMNNIPANGRAVYWAEDPNIKKIRNETNVNSLTYGFQQGDIRASDIEILPFGSYFNVRYHKNNLGKIKLQIPGRHNILNALAAIAVSMYLGLSFTGISNALTSFSGPRRRFEKKGLIGDILVVDDYAHHPTEIKATLQAAKNTGYERIITVFQPHRYTRTKHLLSELAASFDLTDHLIVTDIYGAGEKPLPDVSSRQLVDLMIKEHDLNVVYIPELDDTVPYLQKLINPRDLIITMGAGNVFRAGEILLKRIKKYREMA